MFDLILNVTRSFLVGAAVLLLLGALRSLIEGRWWP